MENWGLGVSHSCETAAKLTQKGMKIPLDIISYCQPLSAILAALKRGGTP